MASLTGKTPKNTYKDILQVSNSNAGVDATVRQVEDGEGTGSAIYLSTGQLAVKDGTAATPAFAFTNDPDTGLWLKSVGKMEAVVGGTAVWDMAGARFGAPDGTVGTPGLGFKDDTDSGMYRIGANNFAFAAAGAKVWEVDSAGLITKPLQCAFLARSGALANKTGNNTNYTVVFATEIYDQNADFDATSTFTAPVTGRYLLGGSFDITQIGASNTVRVRVVTSNRTIDVLLMDAAAIDAAGDLRISWSHGFDMDAADTVTVTLLLNGAGGDTVDITESYFWGFLVV